MPARLPLQPEARHPVFRSALFTPTLLVAAAVTAPARADVEWHADLDTAHAAARISRRPVLAVFTARWGADADSLEQRCLASPEAEAVLATCFEPVRIDTDAHPDLTRAVGITHVPTACVLGDDDTPLTTFEMPDSPSAFVTTAILAAQRAATPERGPMPDDDDDLHVAASDLNRRAGTVFGSAADPAAIASRPQRGSMARVVSKVRELSAFAHTQGRPAVTAQPVAIAQVSRAAVAPAPMPTPVGWPAERAAMSPTTVAAAPAIEPPATTLTPSTVAPWLDAAPATPQASPAAATTAAAPLPPTATPEAAPPPRSGGLFAALQKPFGIVSPKPAEPPTMPPARPQGLASAAATQPADTGPASADAHGSMPLGLEGYCPVTLVDRGAWKEGRAQWGARHRGRTYLFAGSEEQQTFLTNPDRYAPALSGDDPVLALDRGSSTPGQRRYGVTYQSRMYLFATPETREAFAADPGRYTSRIALAERAAPASSSSRLY